MRVGEGFDRLVNILAVINTHCPFLECLYCLLGSRAHGRIRVRFFNDGRFIRDNSSLVSEIVERNDCALKGNFGGILCADLIQGCVRFGDRIFHGSFDCFRRLFPFRNC